MSLRARLVAAVAYVLVLAIVALAVPLGLSMRDRIDAEVRSQARAQADLVAASAADAMPSGRARLATLSRVAARTMRGRVVIVDQRGIVVADSGGPAWLGTSYRTRPEIVRALLGQDDQAVRRSATLNKDILATATPIARRGRTIGAVRITQSIGAVHGAVRRALGGLILVAAVVLGMGLIVGVVVAAQLAGPVRRLDGVVRRLAAGDMTATCRVEGSTEQRALAQAFNDMTARIRRMLAAQREFVADASHQLRTPLTALRLRIEAVARTSRDARARRQLEGALEEVDRLALVIAELLELSQAGEPDAPGVVIDVAVALQAAARRWTPAAERREQTLIVDAAASCHAWCAEADLDRIVDALVENALAYSPPGSAVTLACTRYGLTVADEGPGLAAGEEEAVFERFHRGSAGRQGPSGTGLGLAIARELATRWGGSVTLAGRPESGAIATLTLPALEPAQRTALEAVA